MSIKYDKYEFQGIVFDVFKWDRTFTDDYIGCKSPDVLISFFNDIGQDVQWVRYKHSFIRTHCIDVETERRPYRALIYSTIKVESSGKITAWWINGLPKRLQKLTISELKQHNTFVLNFITTCFRYGFIKIMDEEDEEE